MVSLAVASKQNTPTTDIFSLQTDRQLKGELKAIFCPTNVMMMDHHTKLLQGHKLCKFRKVIANSQALCDCRSALESHFL